MAVILDRESTISMFSVLSCGHGSSSHLVHVDNNHLSFHSALWFAIGFKLYKISLPMYLNSTEDF